MAARGSIRSGGCRRYDGACQPPASRHRCLSQLALSAAIQGMRFHLVASDFLSGLGESARARERANHDRWVLLPADPPRWSRGETYRMLRLRSSSDSGVAAAARPRRCRHRRPGADPPGNPPRLREQKSRKLWFAEEERHGLVDWSARCGGQGASLPASARRAGAADRVRGEIRYHRADSPRSSWSILAMSDDDVRRETNAL